MPYEKEFANSYGYEPLLTDKFVEERLRTFFFMPPEQESDRELLDLFRPVDASELPRDEYYTDPTRAVAIDGSLATASEDFNFELAAVKIGVVAEDLASKARIRQARGPVDPELFQKLYRTGSFLTLLPGEGVYGSTPGEDTWQDKFRQELFEAFKHIRVPFVEDSMNLVGALKQTVPSDVATTCLACHEARKLKPEDNSVRLSDSAPYCPSCFREFNFTDFLFTESWLKDSKSSALFLAMMLIQERVLIQSLMLAAQRGSQRLRLDRTVFITDGPLAIYSTHSLNKYFLEELQRHDRMPLLMGVEKTGTYARYAQRLDVQTKLAPGHVAMITSELANGLSGQPLQQATDYAYSYGKRFVYRTRNGEKTFVFMALPKQGAPVRLKTKDNSLVDDWANYPSVGHLCDFIENNSTDQFGAGAAALDIIAEANHAASLPKTLSAKFLNELILDVSMPGLV